MRTGPFSRTAVIEKLNAAFVPVYAVNEDYRSALATPEPERRLFDRIYREALAKKFSAGSVHAYVLSPDGEVIGTRHVAEAAKKGEMERFLAEMQSKTGTASGATLVTPKPQSKAPECDAGSLKLHLVSRPVSGGGSWDGTAENWIVYDPADARKLLPKDMSSGTSWSIERPLAERLLTHVYPVTENNDPKKNDIETAALDGKVVSVAEGKATASLSGRLRMAHDFYHKKDGKRVEAQLEGYVEWVVATGKITALRLATTKAEYGGGKFAVAVREE